MDSIDLVGAAEALTEHWSPKVVGRINDQYLKVAKVEGEFLWHAHDDEDELFVVLRGTLVIEMEDGGVTLDAGQAFVVPRGVRHRPVAMEECLIALVEPVGTLHTGSEVSDRTRTIEDQLG
ncbi:MAG: cupin domain-containing protein [Gemmatimonadota bacterium]|nr:cupin domain-containing protein [Gemmatimonadota bacterium]MDH5758317.1 cupin domain-containing protein [Gemmatimonadota bacterium]